MSFKVLRICANCANKVKKGEGFLVLRLLPYTWRGKPTRGLFCWHHQPAGGKDQPPAAGLPTARDTATAVACLLRHKDKTERG